MQAGEFMFCGFTMLKCNLEIISYVPEQISSCYYGSWQYYSWDVHASKIYMYKYVCPVVTIKKFMEAFFLRLHTWKKNDKACSETYEAIDFWVPNFDLQLHDSIQFNFVCLNH